MRFALLLILLPFTCFADEFDILAKDIPLGRDEVRAVTAGQVLQYYDGGQSKYSVGGAYSYTYASGASAFGVFTVRDDAAICVTYHNGRSRCDRFVRSHGRLVLLTQEGGRFPIRPQE